MDKDKIIYLPNNEVHIVEPESPIASKKITFDSPRGLEAEEWLSEAEHRQEMRKEIEEEYDYAKIELQSDRPLAIGITGDWHLGSSCNIEMLRQDLEILSEHPLVAGGFFMGDLTESANFNPAQDEMYFNLEEQRAMMESMLDLVGKDRVLGLWRGNHDFKWERKHGTSKYTGLSKKYEAPVFYGNAYLDIFVNDINYRGMGSHRLRGSSIYNNAHASVRGHREIQGLDFVISGHNHKKGVNAQAVREFNGARKIYAISSGTYSTGGGYAKDSGFGTQKNEEQGMYWIILGHQKKLIRTGDTEEMLETMAGYL
jgi:hypothetical protein